MPVADLAAASTTLASPRPRLILASTSRYRSELLMRLRLPFEVVAPGVDEAALPGEAPAEMAARLSQAKAAAVAGLHPAAIVIGSDQVCELDGLAIGKPGTHERAVQQLRQLSGQRAVFHTSVCVLRGDVGYAAHAAAPVVVRFRHFADEEIEHYLRTEQPYDCAGSAKCETLGIALLEAIDSDDPTALVGLPLIRTSRMLREAGLDALRP